MKKAVIALSLAILLLTLCFFLHLHLHGYGKEQADGDAAGMFKYVRVPLGYILVDQQTGIMYWMTFDEYHGTYSPITMLVNSDGTPKVWDGEIQ